MKRLFSTCVIAAGLTLGAYGCNESPEGGKPGTEKTFTISGPTIAPTIKQGEKEAVELDIDRDEHFTSKVTLSADAPEGLDVTFPKQSFAPADGEKAQMMVAARNDAVPGKKTITVTAKPETGNPTSLQVEVDVEAAGNN